MIFSPVECACEMKGSLSAQCDVISGECICKSYAAGRRCDRCESGYFGFPRCRQCVCNPYGTLRNARKGNSICASGLDKVCSFKVYLHDTICGTRFSLWGIKTSADVSYACLLGTYTRVRILCDKSYRVDKPLELTDVLHCCDDPGYYCDVVGTIVHFQAGRLRFKP